MPDIDKLPPATAAKVGALLANRAAQFAIQIAAEIAVEAAKYPDRAA